MEKNEKWLLLGGGVLLVLIFLMSRSSSSPAPPQVIYPRYSNIVPTPADNSLQLANLQAQYQKQQLGVRLVEDMLAYRLYLNGQQQANATNSGTTQTATAAANQNYYQQQNAFLQSLPF